MRLKHLFFGRGAFAGSEGIKFAGGRGRIVGILLAGLDPGVLALPHALQAALVCVVLLHLCLVLAFEVIVLHPLELVSEFLHL